jgi:hypothetical protein
MPHEGTLQLSLDLEDPELSSLSSMSQMGLPRIQGDVLTFIADFTHRVAELYARAEKELDAITAGIMQRIAPPKKPGLFCCKVLLWKPEGISDGHRVLEKFEQLPTKPLPGRHLLEIVRQFPRSRIPYPLAALGSSWQEEQKSKDGSRQLHMVPIVTNFAGALSLEPFCMSNKGRHCITFPILIASHRLPASLIPR